MLVDFRFLFLGESSNLEIWHTYYLYRNDLVEKISWKKKFSALGRVSKLAVVEF